LLLIVEDGSRAVDTSDDAMSTNVEVGVGLEVMAATSEAIVVIVAGSAMEVETGQSP
jgi:hypothetical protein